MFKFINWSIRLYIIMLISSFFFFFSLILYIFSLQVSYQYLFSGFQSWWQYFGYCIFIHVRVWWNERGSRRCCFYPKCYWPRNQTQIIKPNLVSLLILLKTFTRRMSHHILFLTTSNNKNKNKIIYFTWHWFC